LNDDIVTRLRELANMGGFLVTVETMFQAADEIERIRAELDAYRERNAWVERHD